MDDDMSKKIKQITDILGQENLQDNLMGLMSMLTSSNEKKESAEPQETASENSPERASRIDSDENLDFVRKIKSMLDRVDVTNDPRVTLLTAIKPFLNKNRQKHIANCISVLHMTKLARLKDDFGKGEH